MTVLASISRAGSLIRIPRPIENTLPSRQSVSQSTLCSASQSTASLVISLVYIPASYGLYFGGWWATPRGYSPPSPYRKQIVGLPSTKQATSFFFFPSGSAWNRIVLPHIAPYLK